MDSMLVWGVAIALMVVVFPAVVVAIVETRRGRREAALGRRRKEKHRL